MVQIFIFHLLTNNICLEKTYYDFFFSFDANSYFVVGHLEHDVIYNGLRGIFQARGPVCFMFVHKVCMQEMGGCD